MTACSVRSSGCQSAVSETRLSLVCRLICVNDMRTSKTQVGKRRARARSDD
jgi:hypothetical protein